MDTNGTQERRPYRREAHYPCTVRVKISSLQRQQLEQYCDAAGVSMSVAVRRCIDDRLPRLQANQSGLLDDGGVAV